PMPFEEPVSAVRLGSIDGKFVPFPSHDELEGSELDLIVSGTREAVAMIEGFAREMPEERMMEAILESHRIIKILCQMQLDLREQAGTVKAEYAIPKPDELLPRLTTKYYAAFKGAKQTVGKKARADAVTALKEKALAAEIPDPAAAGATTPAAFA